MARSNGDLIAKAREIVENAGPARPRAVAEANAARSWGYERALGHPRARSLPAAAGRVCSLLLADFGAEVLKVEDTGMGDYIRWSPPYYEGVEDSAKSALFLALNRGKRSIRLDLKSDGGREVLLRLVREYDVVLESFRPGVMERLGRRLRDAARGEPAARLLRDHGLRPGRSVHGTLGARHELPRPERAARAVGRRRRPPVQPAGQIADLGGGALMAAFGILAALRERERSGEGQLVDVSMFDGALSWLALVAAQYLADGVPPAARRGRGTAGHLLPALRLRDGWVTLGALEPKFWQEWCRGVGREDLVEKQFEPPGSEAHAEVERIFLERTRDEWQAFASSSTTAASSLCWASTRRSTRARAGARDGRGARPAGRRGEPVACSACR